MAKSFPARIRRKSVVIAWLAACSCCPGAQAGDLQDLEQGLPLAVEDTKSTEPGTVDLQGIFRYQRLRAGCQGRDQFQANPRVQAGVAPGLQFSFSAPYRFGDAPDTGQGDLRLDALYNFRRESGAVPALAIDLGLERPYGSASGGTEVSLKGIATKSLGPAAGLPPPQVHLNLTWYRNLSPESVERQNRYFVGAAYSRPMSERWLLAASLFREGRRERGLAENMAEVGLRLKLSQESILAAGLGRGLNENAPRWRALVGLHRSFK